MSTPAVGTWVRSLLAGLLLVLGLSTGPIAPAAAADPASDCIADGGIYVYVFDQDAKVVEGCTHADTGLGRLLELTSVQTTGSGFICQIAGLPDRCVGNPAGEDPYWGYWWWRDEQWRYATIGGSYRGVSGSIEAWHFSPGEPPSMTPAASAPASAAPEQTSPATPPASPPASADPAADTAGPPGWANTAITIVAVGALVLGYGLLRRPRDRG